MDTCCLVIYVQTFSVNMRRNQILLQVGNFVARVTPALGYLHGGLHCKRVTLVFALRFHARLSYPRGRIMLPNR